MTSPKTLSLVIPCYNEARTLIPCVKRVLAIATADLTLELIIVDDCSTDKSLVIARELAKYHPEVTVLHHEKNRGKGASLRTGFAHATGDFVGVQDADMEYDPQEYHVLLRAMLEDKADVVFGSRYLKTDAWRVLYFWHTWMNNTLTSVSNMFTNLDITDMETCYKLFRREIIQGIDLREDRFGFEPEVTAKVAQTRCRVYECAISYTPPHARGRQEDKLEGRRPRALLYPPLWRAHRSSADAAVDIFFHWLRLCRGQCRGLRYSVSRWFKHKFCNACGLRDFRCP